MKITDYLYRLCAVFMLSMMPSMMLSIWASPVLAQESTGQQSALTIARVNGEPLSLNLLGSLIEQLPEQLRQQPLEGYYDQLVDDMIDTRLIANAARAEGLDANPVLAELAMRAFDGVLAQAWLNQNIRGGITEAVIEAEYTALVADEASREEISVSHILLGSIEAAEEVIMQLNDGADFAELAVELSQGPSAPNGGDLGYIRRGATVATFEAAAFALEVGRFSQIPVQTQFGFHVILVEDKRIAPAPSLDEARGQLINALFLRQTTEALAELREGASIERLSFEEMREAELARREAGQ